MVTQDEAKKSPFLLKFDNKGNVVAIRASGPQGGQIIGSIYKTNEGNSFLSSGDGILISSGTNGQVRIESYFSAGTNMLVASASNGEVRISRDVSSSIYVANNSTTLLPIIDIEQLSTGDAGIRVSIPTDSYVLGIDQSDEEQFKISYGNSNQKAVLGTTDYFVIENSGKTIVKNNLFVGTNCTITGTLSKGAGTFLIPHPDPAKKDSFKLRHSFVESPTAGDNIYRFSITASSSDEIVNIPLPSYYQYLNENTQIWVSPFEHYGSGWGEISNDLTQLHIHCEKKGAYNILCIGTRKDKIAKDFWDDLGGVEVKAELL